MKELIVPLTKCPHEQGRIGPREKQDWFQTVLLSKKLLAKYPEAKIAIISSFIPAGQKSEVSLYLEAIDEISISRESVRVIPEGYETIGQIEVLEKIQRKEHARIFLISTPFHFPRIWWLCKRMRVKVRHHIAFGLPQIKGAIIDIALTAIYPILDLCGLKFRFKEGLVKRRKNGIL